ncbi:MAG: cytochrome c [Hyphomicrobiaceae bacterium]
MTRRIGGLAASSVGLLFICMPATAADAAYGEYLAAECTTCHRSDGKDKGIPSIVGWPPEQLVSVLVSYKTKDRPGAVMQTIAARLGDEDIAALAAYFAKLKPRAIVGPSAIGAERQDRALWRSNVRCRSTDVCSLRAPRQLPAHWLWVAPQFSVRESPRLS